MDAVDNDAMDELLANLKKFAEDFGPCVVLPFKAPPLSGKPEAPVHGIVFVDYDSNLLRGKHDEQR